MRSEVSPINREVGVVFHLELALEERSLRNLVGRARVVPRHLIEVAEPLVPLSELLLVHILDLRTYFTGREEPNLQNGAPLSH